MSVSNRASLITKTHKVLKKHYEPVVPPSDRTLLEHLLYACCLENAHAQPADDAFAKLQEVYFDWNEVRVTTVTELSEAMSSLPDARAAAMRLRRVLQAVFETHFSFEIDSLKKENIGVAIKKIEKYDGASQFCVSYVTQAALGGHSIAADKGVLDALLVIGIITENEAKSGRTPGMERAIPKTKGVEFASLLHQLGADYFASPFSPRVRNIILEIAPDAKQRFPKRQTKKAEQPEAKPKKKKKTEKESAKKPSKAAATKKKAAKKKQTKSKKSASPAASSRTKKKTTTKRLSKKKPR